MKVGLVFFHRRPGQMRFIFFQIHHFPLKTSIWIKSRIFLIHCAINQSFYVSIKTVRKGGNHYFLRVWVGGMAVILIELFPWVMLWRGCFSNRHLPLFVVLTSQTIRFQTTCLIFSQMFIAYQGWDFRFMMFRLLGNTFVMQMFVVLSDICYIPPFPSGKTLH